MLIRRQSLPMNVFYTVSMRIILAQQVNLLISFLALSTLWPCLIPGSAKGKDNPALNSWFQFYMRDATLFSALTFGALSHKQVNCSMVAEPGNQLTAVEKQGLIFYEMESARMINKTLQHQPETVTDTLILSALCMANNSANEVKLHHVQASPFTPPLQRLQWLDIYGRMSSSPAHQRGLLQLITLRGGLECVELPGLAAILSL